MSKVDIKETIKVFVHVKNKDPKSCTVASKILEFKWKYCTMPIKKQYKISLKFYSLRYLISEPTNALYIVLYINVAL